jgi:hypothetical protein
MIQVTQIEITPRSLARLGQALDYRCRIRQGQYDEDGIDLMDVMGTLYRELAKNHSEAVYGPDSLDHNVMLGSWPTMDELFDALTTLEQFGMLQLLHKDESHLDKEN